MAQDAADYYAGVKTGADLGMPWLTLPNLFPIVPMDSVVFSPADEGTGQYQWQPDTSGFFSNNSASNYIFHFINQVVAELHAIDGHANDKVSTLAYYGWASPPTNVTLDPSVAVQFCFSESRLMYDQAGYAHEMGYVQGWKAEAAVSGRALGLWLYPWAPWYPATSHGELLPRLLCGYACR